MCHLTVIRFVEQYLTAEDVAGKRVLEVGSRDVNGTVRPTVEALGPADYVGVDIEDGPGVDRIMDAADLVEVFGEASFDVVISTELVEHTRYWRTMFDQMKRVLRPGGVVVVTTRSPGFMVHGYPWDFWRYTPDDMRAIFVDFSDVHVEDDDDELRPGVFVTAHKPDTWKPADLTGVMLHSVVTRSPTSDVTNAQVARFKVRHTVHRAYRTLLPESVRALIKRVVSVFSGWLQGR